MIDLDLILKDKKEIAIGGHVRPDGDCVGSVLGMYNYIRNNFPNANVRAYLEYIPRIFMFLKGAEDLIEPSESDESVDLFICLDCADKKRLGPSASRFAAAKETLCIDHHLSNTDFAKYNHIVPDYSSTCELLYDIFGEEKITKEIAECLYTGIIHDTGVFRFDCTTKETMKKAGILMDKGIDFPSIIDKTFFQKTFNQNRILGHSLEKAVRLSDNRIVATFITFEEMKEYDVQPRHLEGIVNALRDTKDSLAAVFLYELEVGHFKVSMRATADINLADIASRYGGGGHAKAAGCEVDGDPVEAIANISQEIEALF